MKVFLGCVVLSVMIALVFSARCHHGDISMCGGLTCSGAGETVGCEHDVCTCVQSGNQAQANQACSTLSDCSGMNMDCKHGESMHCIDNMCKCMHGH